MFPPQKLSLHASNKVHVGRAGLVTPATGFSRDLCQKQLTTRVYLELKPKLRL